MAVGSQVMLIFGLICAILVAIGAFLFLSLRTIENENRVLQDQILDVLSLNDGIAGNLRLEQNEISRYVDGQDASEWKRHELMISSLEKTSEGQWNAYAKFVGNERDAKLYATASEDRKKYLEATASLLALSRANRQIEARSFALSAQAPAYEEYQRAIDEMVNSTATGSGQTAMASTSLIGQTRQVGDLLIGIAVLVSIGAAFALWSITRRLKEDNTILQIEIAERLRAEKTLHESEQKFQQLADNISDVFWSTSPDMGIVHYVSAAYEIIWGLSRESLYAHPHQWIEAILPEDRERVVAVFTKLMADTPQVSAEYRITRLDGTVRWVQDRGFQVRDAAGTLIRLAGIASDITERREAEDALDRQQAELRILFDLLPAMICFKDTEGRILRANKRFAENFGITVRELEGKPASEVSANCASRYKAADSEVIRSGKPKIGMVEMVPDRNGAERWIQTDMVPLCGIDDKVKGIVVMVLDITERKHADETVTRLAAIVENSDDAIIGKTLKGIITSWNTAAEKMFGYTAAEIIGQPLSVIVPPERLGEEIEILAGLGRGELVRHVETVRVRKDGRRLDVSATISAIKDNDGKLVGASKIVRDVTAQKRTEARYRLLVDSNIQGVLFWNQNGEITGANDAFLRLINYTREDLEAGCINWRALTPPEYAHLDQRCLDEIAAKGVSAPYEKEYLVKGGSRVPILLGAAAFADSTDEGICFVIDQTERKGLEARLFQAQKMETIGKLAGGVAHEFNSILTAIIGQSELLLGDLPPESPLNENAAEIHAAATRAAVLTRQLLAYSRKQILQPESLDLNAVLAGMERTLRHVAGSATDIRIVPAADLKAIKADALQLEHVIMNMVINAIDAMPDGGKLTLETANVTLDDAYRSHFPDLKAGDYVMLAITDTGMGMSLEVKSRVFDPFFSTKTPGSGTGLGLSTSYGIIKQSGGHINVYSEPGRGTSFKIYLPQMDQLVRTPARPSNPSALPRGTETILLVEDDPALREMAGSLLTKLGYTIRAAENGVEALRLKQLHETEPIDLLFTDVVMPQMNGKELSELVQAMSPNTKILFTSAYTENAIVHQGVLDRGVALLQKPFTPSALAHKLRDVLDHSSPL